MTGDPSGPSLTPTGFEREQLKELIDRSLEDDDKKTGSPNDALFAMIDVFTHYGFMMPLASRLHLKRMIVVYSELAAQLEGPAQQTFSRSLKISMHDQLQQFESFKADLSDMTPPWRVAMHDVIVSYVEPKEDAGEDERGETP